MKNKEFFLRNKIEKESIALFKKNLLKESYNWFKDTDYFVKLKNENKYSNIENKTETKNLVTGRVQLGWGGTFFLLCCVVVICDNSAWQSCNHYIDSIFYSPESLTLVYSFLFIVYVFPLFIFHQCLGLVSQGNYVKSCRMLSSHLGILSIFSLFGTITFCSKEICNFSIELLQNFLRLFNSSTEKKYGMTKIFIDLTNKKKDCSTIPDTIYVESLNQCISFSDKLIVNFYESLWFIGNKDNYIYLIIISTIFILFCYFILLKENFRVFKFFIFVIIINWITTKSVVIMNTFFSYIPQRKKIYEEIVLIFKEVGFVKLTIFLYGTVARSSSIFILSTFASYFHTNTNILKISIYTFAFYILNMYFYLKNEAHEYFLYNQNLGNNSEFNFIKCNTYINLLNELNNKTNRITSTPSKDVYVVWQKLCLFFSSYSFLFSTLFIVLMQLLGPFNILSETHYKNEYDNERKIYSYKSLVKKYEKYDLKHSTSNNRISSKRKSVSNETFKNKKKFFLNLDIFKKKKKKVTEQKSYLEEQNSHKTKSFKETKSNKESSFISRKNSLFFNENSKSHLLSDFVRRGRNFSYNEGDYDKMNLHFEESSLGNSIDIKSNCDNNKTESKNIKSDKISIENNSDCSKESLSNESKEKSIYNFMRIKQNSNYSSNREKKKKINTSKTYNENSVITNAERKKKKKKSKTKKKEENRIAISKFMSKLNYIIMKKYGTFILFFIIYIFTILHIVDFKRNNNIVSEIILYSLYRSFLIFIICVQIIYSSWIFGIRLQMSQCGVLACSLNFITWIVVLPTLYLIYFKKKLWINILIVGVLLNIISIITSYIEVKKKLKVRESNGINECNKLLIEYSKFSILKKCLYWLYFGNLEILRKNINIAISGNEEKYIPFFWNFLFKYINSSMLIIVIIRNTKEYFIDMLDVFEKTFSLQIELISIFMVLLGSFIVLLNNLYKDYYKPQNVIIPSIPMVCHNKKRYIFPD
ncbi:conserved Plasmodium protein, unknown function [Plasmodium gallinaceum]|uniref:Transporter n=1 Tax=Plasmodium gallinaceum TaxID=5849 RepID=A0A1J1GPT2_PLAGA|nr:conserved Plasmodium protein, unknown function [Plasmodium gallinaceum]CRG94302.1 conserved Plasmodium protein, unknown function [Plasmodium gallinaceum]